MCFYIHSKHQTKKIAKRDIVCYKILFKQTLRSPYYYMVYELSRLYKIELEKPRNGFNYVYICKGFHSYSNKRKIIWCPHRFFYCVVKGIIPKGSEYYYNPDRHEYVSNQIILQEIIK